MNASGSDQNYWTFEKLLAKCFSITDMNVSIYMRRTGLRTGIIVQNVVGFASARMSKIFLITWIQCGFVHIQLRNDGINDQLCNLLFDNVLPDNLQYNYPHFAHQKEQETKTIAPIHHVDDRFGFVHGIYLHSSWSCLVLSGISDRLRWILFLEYLFHRHIPFQCTVDQTDNSNRSLLGHCASNELLFECDRKCNYW